MQLNLKISVSEEFLEIFKSRNSNQNFQSDKEREARNNPSWSFCNFFILQEEIAILYESLGLHSDALIQYDELDALLTQYLENSRTYPGIVMHTITKVTQISTNQQIQIIIIC